MTAKPAVPRLEALRPTEVAQFIAAAPGKVAYPWKGAQVRSDVAIQLNVKIPEPLNLMLEWYAYQMRTTKRDLVTEAVRRHMDDLLRQIGIEP